MTIKAIHPGLQVDEELFFDFCFCHFEASTHSMVFSSLRLGQFFERLNFNFINILIFINIYSYYAVTL